ncbi:hypothetical protein LDENG_00267710 [Lucifuga dentata]|nr:hypothetical protein LDENG_00267710 [Lucifuga dentata]
MCTAVTCQSSFSSLSSIAASGAISLARGSSQSRMSTASSIFSTGRAPSVYGVAGGYGTCVSQSESFCGVTLFSDTAVFSNEKVTMQNLNNHLASYLEKVRSLEAANKKLELQIREFHEKRIPVSKDLSGFFNTISDLRAQELQLLRAQQGIGVNVEVDSNESADLTEILTDLRKQYEAVMLKNKEDIEKWFNQKKQCLEQNLADVGSRYSARISHLQQIIILLETEIQQLTVSIQQQATEYKMLLDIKMRLVMEIAEYRRLLDGEAQTRVVNSKMVEEVEEQKLHKERVVKTVVQEVVDGKVVSSVTDIQVEEIQ